MMAGVTESTPAAVTLPSAAKDLLDSPEFATIATVLPNGLIQQSVVWVARDGEELVFATVEGRRKHLNLLADPRCTVLVYPRANPYSYLELRGVATMTREGGRELIDDLHEKYLGSRPYPNDGPDDMRVVVRLKATKVVWHG